MRSFVIIFCTLLTAIIFVVILQGCQKSNHSKESSSQLVQPSNKREKEDIQVIELLKKAGSDLSKPHQIEHHFCVYGDKDKAYEAILQLKSQEYEIVDIEEGIDKGKKYYYFDAIKSSMVKPEIIFAQTLTMEEIAEKYDIVYDGWGCMVVKD